MRARSPWTTSPLSQRELVRRHPHVFEDSTARTATEVTGQWERLKAEERSKKGEETAPCSPVSPAPCPRSPTRSPVLSRARRAGFDWDDPDAVFDKVAEEAGELRDSESPQRREESSATSSLRSSPRRTRMDIDAEQALRGANDRFATRFHHVEDALRRDGRTLTEMPVDAKLALWEEAKAAE